MFVSATFDCVFVCVFFCLSFRLLLHLFRPASTTLVSPPPTVAIDERFLAIPEPRQESRRKNSRVGSTKRRRDDSKYRTGQGQLTTPSRSSDHRLHEGRSISPLRPAMRSLHGSLLKAALAGAALANGVLAMDVLETVGFTICNDQASVSVQRVDIKYLHNDRTITFDVAGTSKQVQNVTAVLSVTAYGHDIFSNSFNPCNQETFVEQLCPGTSPSLLQSSSSSSSSSSVSFFHCCSASSVFAGCLADPSVQSLSAPSRRGVPRGSQISMRISCRQSPSRSRTSPPWRL